MKTITFKIKELECSSCAQSIEKQLNKNNINDVQIDVMSKTVTINYDESKFSENDLLKFLKKAGFSATVV